MINIAFSLCLDDYSEYDDDSELTAEKFLSLEREKQQEGHDNEASSHDFPKTRHVTEVKDNKITKRDYHEMIDSLIKDWYHPAKYLETEGYLTPESNDVGKDFLGVEEEPTNDQNPSNSSSVLDKIKKTLKKVFKPGGYGTDNESSLIDGFDAGLIDAGLEKQVNGVGLSNLTVMSSTTVVPPSNVTTIGSVNVTEPNPVIGIKNDSVLVEKYPKILKQFSEDDMQFLKHFLSCLKQSANLTTVSPIISNVTSNVASLSKNTSRPLVASTTSASVTKNDKKPTNNSISSVSKEMRPNPNVTKEVNDGLKSINETHFVLKCIPMPSPAESEMISFNCKFIHPLLVLVMR